VSLTIRPLTPEVWPALEDLFGAAGASNGCWCMYWRIGPAYRGRSRDENKVALRDLVEQGPPPGLLAFDGDLAVGWCQLTPRASLAWLAGRPWAQLGDELHAWSISCFYVRKRYRHRGVTAALITAALEVAKRSNAPAVEAYPVDTAMPKSTTNLYTGTASTFRKLGFTTVGTAAYGRVIMRHDLGSLVARRAWR
jgi:GNAT superfamily N-acetyltransferase